VSAARVGVVGCGAVAESYLDTLAGHPDVTVVACADADMTRTDALADQFDIAAVSVADLLADDDVDIVLNLTPPAHHHATTLAAIRAGRHVYSEKPLALTTEHATELSRAAAARGVRLGCAPDTFLSSAMRTARRMLVDGAIGRPLGGRAVSFWRPEDRHPRPEFLYQPGGGPIFDMYPYHITAFCAFFGPVARVYAAGATIEARRVVAVGPRAGTTFDADTATHVSATLEFHDGPLVSLIAGFESTVVPTAGLEIFGTTSALALGDPQGYAPSLSAWHADGGRWRPVPVPADHPAGRGIGLIDLARAIRDGTPHSAEDGRAAHVLDVMLAIDESVRTGVAIRVPWRELTVR
jgi:predicted dehydrogenase